MFTWLNHLRQINRFLARQSLYPVVLSSLLACGIFAGRVYLSHTWVYRFLAWNLFLAWVPYVCSLWAAFIHQRHPKRWWALALPGALWLVFFPNAPYILTDLGHLRERTPIPPWYDIGLFLTFAWTGCFLGLASLRTMQRLVKAFWGWAVGWVFVIGTLGLSGLGIYLGRFLRWNSWDLILHPRGVLMDVATRLAHPRHNLQTFGVTLMFAAFLLVCYLTFTSFQCRERA
jgi:uncharacterized membrane protein